MQYISHNLHSYTTKAIFLALLLISTQTVNAKTPLSLVVTHKNNIYKTRLSVTIKTQPETLFKLLTAYRDLHKLSQLIKKSQLQTDGKLLLELESCFTFICFNKIQVMSLDISPYTVTGTIKAEQSDFSSGWARWHISKIKEGSKLSFISEMSPKFWVPPFIGPWLIKQKLTNEALYSIHAIESHTAIKQSL